MDKRVRLIIGLLSFIIITGLSLAWERDVTFIKSNPVIMVIASFIAIIMNVITNISKVIDFFNTIVGLLKKTISSQNEKLDMSVIISDRKFEYNKFKSNLETFKSLPDGKTKYDLQYRMRHQLTRLSWDKFSIKERNVVLDLLNELKKKIHNIKLRELSLEMLSILCNKRDKLTIHKIKKDFLEFIETKYELFNLKEKSDALRIQQMLNNYDNEFIKNNVYNSIKYWDEDEFYRLYHSLETSRLKNKYRKQIKKTLWIWKAECEKKSNQVKLKRIDRYLNKDEFQ